MNTFLSILLCIIVGATMFGGYKLIIYLFENPSILRPSFHRRHAFMKKWRDQATDALVNFQITDVEKFKECFSNVEISKGETPDWQVVRSEYKGVSFSVHVNNKGAFWLQLPPFHSEPKSLSFDQQRDISVRIKEDFAPIRINFKTENGYTKFFLVGEYIDSIEAWEETDDGLWLECADKESAEVSKQYYSEYIPDNAISIEQASDDEMYVLNIPADYKPALIKAESPYYPMPDGWQNYGEFNKDVPDQPFTSQESLIISPSAELVKAWIDLYLFIKKEFDSTSLRI